MRPYPDLDSASDWSCRVGNLFQPMRSTSQIWVVTRHEYEISALVSQMSFGEETSGSVSKSFAQKLLASCLKQSKRNEGQTIQQHRPYWHMKVPWYSFSRSIPAKFEHKLRCHKQTFGKIATTVVLGKDENLSWSGLQWHQSCHSNEMTPLPIILAALFLTVWNSSWELFPPIVASMFLKLKRNL